MRIPDRLLYEYAIVRYVPRVDREEFVNIGLIMMCKRSKWLHGEIRLNSDRVRAFDPRCNIDSILTQSSLFMREDVPSAGLPVEERYRWLAAVKSAVLQVSPSHPGIITVDDDFSYDNEAEVLALLNQEFERLLAELVDY